VKRSLHEYFAESARAHPAALAVVAPGRGSMSYGALDRLSTALAARLLQLGVAPGDRVGFILHKSIDSLATLLAILKAGAAYVPVDLNAPLARGGYILNDCGVKVVVCERQLADGLAKEIAALGGQPEFIAVDDVGAGQGLNNVVAGIAAEALNKVRAVAVPQLDELAYILYTSGSTGKPKGVMISHRNAMSFVDWCADAFDPRAADRFSSHAPFHFDLSILDIFLSLSSGATLVLIPEDIGKEPEKLAPLIAAERISIWYSAPSILSFLVQYGRLENHDYSALRLVLFAGEVFPVKHLRALCERWPRPRYFNLYGPTETNVCTYYEVPSQIPPERTEPFPIGKTCEHLRAVAVDEVGAVVKAGERGELCIAGPAVTAGYWNLAENTARAFLDRADGPWYRTGDIVVEQPDGDYLFAGRRDRMVKRRGYRVELGEIEAGLYRHPMLKEVAVLALADQEAGVRIRAFLSCHDGKRPSIIQLKKFCVDVLPPYMAPDEFVFEAALPKTSTDKIDYQKLKERPGWISPFQKNSKS